jgi:mRNA interferase RelE/StbE
MKVLFDAKFSKKIDKIKDPKLAARIFKVIMLIKNAKSLNEISNLKRLTGHSAIYRFRMGDYRIGLELIDENTFEFLDFDKRNDFYKNFP